MSLAAKYRAAANVDVTSPYAHQTILAAATDIERLEAELELARRMLHHATATFVFIDGRYLMVPPERQQASVRFALACRAYHDHVHQPQKENPTP